MPKITVDEFTSRLAAICLSQGGSGLPRRHQDRHILFRSVTLTLDPGRSYSESDLNLALTEWLDSIGQAIAIDHVSLRRYLVDEGYLVRDLAGVSYRVGAEVIAENFEPETNAIDPAAVLAEARRLREERKQQHAANQA